MDEGIVHGDNTDIVKKQLENFNYIRFFHVVHAIRALILYSMFSLCLH